jgi:hypothetical protein
LCKLGLIQKSECVYKKLEEMKQTSDPSFDRLWKEYPLHVGKQKAQFAYEKAKKIARPDEILAGVERYIAAKPDWQAWAHLSTWLNGRRWLDEYTPVQSMKPDMRGHYPPCRTNTECLKRVLAS